MEVQLIFNRHESLNYMLVLYTQINTKAVTYEDRGFYWMVPQRTLLSTTLIKSM